MLGEYLSKCLENALGYLWPAYRTYKALETGQYDATRQWCIYWGVFGTFSVCEQILDKFLFWVPLYHEMKVAFVIWLWHEKFKGAQYIYYCWVLPWLRQNEQVIDQKVEEFKRKIVQLIVSHSARFSSYLKEGFYNVIILLHSMQDHPHRTKFSVHQRYPRRVRHSQYAATSGSNDGRLEYEDDSDSRYNDNFDYSDTDSERIHEFEEEENESTDDPRTPSRRRRVVEEISMVRQIRSASVYASQEGRNRQMAGRGGVRGYRDNSDPYHYVIAATMTISTTRTLTLNEYTNLKKRRTNQPTIHELLPGGDELSKKQAWYDKFDRRLSMRARRVGIVRWRVGVGLGVIEIIATPTTMRNSIIIIPNEVESITGIHAGRMDRAVRGIKITANNFSDQHPLFRYVMDSFYLLFIQNFHQYSIKFVFV
eukprot:TRINITY_DN45886_c0_g1_i5.p1 TRINITY_DN45886_c0_g1~~TRINITY_DN45886_c0_g1_i5.p1  ORF type:complete len:424 (-),score=31.76 TRINITY_DN45886_c0_g1_i5:1510-2781(-)